MRNQNTKRLYIAIIISFMIFMALAYGLSYAALRYQSQAIKNAYGNIIGSVISNNPQAEEAVVEALKSSDENYTKLGLDIINKYGFDGGDILQTEASLRLYRFLRPLLLGFTGLIFILILLIITLYLLTQRRQLNNVAKYLRNVNSGNYNLDIRDNIEGDISILKNEIYKTTTMLREQTHNLKSDKAHLANALSDISHQLKTPLTSMLVMTDLLRQDNLPKDKRYQFSMQIKSQIERIEWLVVSLLKLSKLDAKTVILKKEKVMVYDLIKKAIEPLMIPLEIKNQSLNISGDNKVSFLGDFNWSSEVITNILKNSIEHTNEDGEINIKYQENSLYTMIQISDNGSGIDKEDIPYIFNRFYKGKNSSPDSVGIGLAMAKTIIENQGGDLSVSSEKNKGTTFTIKIYKGII